MNLGTDLSRKKQEALQEIGITSENREYSKEEIKTFINSIGDFIFSRSSKNGDITRATAKYNDLLNIFIKNEK